MEIVKNPTQRPKSLAMEFWKDTLLIIAFIILAIACDRTEDDMDTLTPDPVMELQINNRDSIRTITEFSNSLSLFDNQNGQSGRTLRLTCAVDTGVFILNITNLDWQDPPTNGVLIKTYGTNVNGSSQNISCQTDNPNTCDSAMAEYHTSFISEDVDFPIANIHLSEQIMDAPEGTITITEVNSVSGWVSGRFDVRVASILAPSDQITFKGTFSHLNY